MTGRFGFDREWQIASPNARQQFLARLNRSLGPAMLLRFETIHVDRQLGRRHHVREKNKFPANELRAIAKIEIFAKRVVLPAPGFFDARFPPQPGGPVEIKETHAAAARRLLEHKVTIQKHRL